MALGERIPHHEDTPEVAAIRKKARGETLTAAEEAVLARVSRRPPGDPRPSISQDQLMVRLEERKRLGV